LSNKIIQRGRAGPYGEDAAADQQGQRHRHGGPCRRAAEQGDERAAVHSITSSARRAIAAGAIRNDIGPEDLIRTLVGMCYTHDQPGWQKSVLVDVFIDGLRSRRTNRQTNTNKKTSP
jgi:hypothetical protein